MSARATRRPAQGAAAPAFGAQQSAASPKQKLLFDLERGRVAVHAAIQGLTAASADEPIGPGKWSTREIILHVMFWDHYILNAIPFALHQNEAPDPDARDTDAINAQGQFLYRAVDWDEARRMLDRTREELRAALEAIPAEPELVWTVEHALGNLVIGFDEHDRHHAAQIKSFRIARGSS